MADPAQSQHPGAHPMHPAHQRIAALGRPIARPRPVLCSDHAARLGQHHAHRQISHIASQHIGGVSHLNAARFANGHIDCIKAHTIDRNNLKLWAGGNDGGIGPQPAIGGDPLYHGADLRQKRGFVSGLVIPVHREFCLKRGLIPIRIAAQLQDLGFGHQMLRWLT